MLKFCSFLYMDLKAVASTYASLSQITKTSCTKYFLTHFAFIKSREKLISDLWTTKNPTEPELKPKYPKYLEPSTINHPFL